MENQPQENAQTKILVVDDDRIIVEVLKQSLTLAGYSIASAANGVEGLALTRELKPDLVLLDVMMPKMDGYSMCRELKSDPETQLIPVIILTALTDRDDKLKALEVGADEFIRKPPDRQELLIRIRSLLRAKRLYEELQRSYQELSELEQIKNDLTSMIVHDMRGPLGSILSGLYMLLETQDGVNGDVYESLLTSSILAGQRIMNMMEAMLDVERLESGQMPVQPQPVHIDHLIEESVQALQPLLQVDGIRIDVQASVPKEAVMVDRDLLARVLNNLLFNAVKFSPDGGRIGIWTQENPKWLILNVADQGPGIPVEQRENIFKKYSQLTPSSSRSGVGLGLAFCRMAVEAMEGRIWVEDMEQAGALFRFTLPYRPAKGQSIANQV